MSGPGRLVVVGASLAGLRAVEAARAAGFGGEITLVGAEPHLPYDRTVLSKSFLAAPAAFAGSPVPHYREPASYTDELGVRLLLGAPATELDASARTVRVGDSAVPYDRLVVATGVRARRLPGAVPLAGVHTLRTVDDARALRGELGTARRVVVVGAGFIGAEVASAARALGAEVTLLDAERSPLSRSVGPELGCLLTELHTDAGSRVRFGSAVERVEGAGRVERVVLRDGTALPADLVVVGIGAEPAVEWLRGSGVTLGDGVVCGSDLATGVPGVYAAGDVLRWHNPLFGRSMRLEHWTNAAEQGAVAARNALGQAREEYAAVPYFWSDWYGVRIQFLGIPEAERVEIVGDPAARRFVALLGTGDRLTGVLAVDRRGEVARYRQLLRARATWHEARDHAARREARRRGTTDEGRRVAAVDGGRG
ncbi:NAD(P)/FAD-dependent oxidoreductase [Streptomyces sp. NPDC048514]|uniref:NAD(P)/FAD-dependent oxidoreductase n=1 Tax=Streptomyces sp. NPDC048514 TaxID=3365564 RepID=UPI00371CCD4E